MKKLVSLFVALIVATTLFASNVITYTATSKLPETTSTSSSGLRTNAFNVSISSHTFSNGTGTITFAGEVTTIGDYAFRNCTGLTSVIIPNSVTTIGNYILAYCTSLTSVTIGNSVTTIGRNAFYGCSGLTSVTIPNSVTTIGYEAFCGCSGLTSITIPNSVTTIGNHAFSDCTGLTLVTINTNAIANMEYTYDNNFSTIFGSQVTQCILGNSVTTIGRNAFYGCSGFTSVTIGNSVTTIGGYAFYDCDGLTSVTIPNSVTSIGWYAFHGCSGLTSVTIGNSVTEIGYNAFSGCSGLTSIDIPNSVTTIGGDAFENCSGLTSVTIGNSVTEIGYNAFSGCSGLTSIDIPNSVTTIGGDAFENCSGLTSVTIGNSVTTIGESAFYNCSGLTLVTINTNAIASKEYTKDSNFSTIFGSQVTQYILGDSVTTIGDCAFYNCSRLTSITIPNSVTTIGDYAFYNCSRLTSITIPNSVTTIGYGAFEGCSGLTSVTIPNSVTTIESSTFDGCNGLTSVTIPNSVTEIGWSAFSDCTGLTSVTIGNSVTTIGDFAFNNCRGLTSVTIPNSVTTIGYGAFEYCSGLTSVTIPNSVTTIGPNAFSMVNNIVYSDTPSGSTWGAKCVNGYVDGYLVYSDASKNKLCGCSSAATGAITIPNSVTTIGDYACYECSGLTSITIPNSVTTIGNHAFSDCTGLTSVTIPNSVTTIGEWAFYSCRGLTSVIIPNSVTIIGDYAFLWCDSLISVTIGNSVTKIGEYAFSNCRGLTSIACYAITPPTCGGSYCFYNVDKTIPVYVPARSVDAYKQANKWKEFTNILPYPNGAYIDVLGDSNMGTIKGAGFYPKGETCTLTVTPNYGYHFTQWSDGNTDNPRSFVLTQDTTFTAQFAINIYSFDVQTADPVMGSVTGTKGNYEHGTSLNVSASSNYGYHFDHWSDGSKQSQRTISLTKNTSLIAYFAKNIYSVNVSKSQYGTIQGVGNYAYLSTCTLTVIPDFGYNFIGWADGNTDNPRSLVVTQDTTFTAQFEQQSTIMGRCGDDLAWNLHNGVLIITGSGDMYDSNYDSWSRWADQITTINLPKGLTHIGQYAFANCVNVTRIDLPASVTSIGCGAFYNDYSIEEITCPTSAVPTVDCDETFYRVSQYVYVYVISDLVRKYQINQYWQKFDIRVLGAEEKPITGDDVIVDPSTDNVTIVWPANDDAAEYKLVITKDGIVFCTLTFNAQGQLTGIAFAPNRAGSRMLDAAVMTATGWQFTVTGLDQASKYGYTIDALNASKQSIKHYEGEFATDGYTSLEWVTSDKIQSVNKMLLDGHLYILRDGNLYTATGARVK